MAYEQLRLKNQICFPIYAASRLFVREYQPYLDALEITYPQYLVLLVLWEKDRVTVGEIAERLLLNTNTITPLLKRMEAQGLIERRRSEDDERKVIVALTEKGNQLQADAVKIPEQFVSGLVSDQVNLEELIHLRDKLTFLIDQLSKHDADLP
ncbi:MAG: MarR family transcriptional regulator [Anaerolineae bacterium]